MDSPPNHENLRVRNVIEQLSHDGSVVAKSDGTKHTIFPVAVSVSESEALRDWVTRENAAHTIEIGLGYGISALHICEGLILNGSQTARHVVLDPNQAGRFANCGLQVLQEAGVRHLVDHYVEESQIALPRFLQEGRRFDLGFVDGNHRFERVFLDLFYLGYMVKPGGIIILDDYNRPGIRRAVSFYVTNLNWIIVEANENGHQVVLRTNKDADNRDGNYFVEF